LPLREGKTTTFDGGLREPCIMRWPGKIPAGTVCRELAATMDLLPTFVRLAGAEVPRDRIIDGRDIWPLMSAQPGATTPHEAYFTTGANICRRCGAANGNCTWHTITIIPTRRDTMESRVNTRNVR